MELKDQHLTPWLFHVEPYPHESFGHFLARFRRANRMSDSHLSSLLNKPYRTVLYWETPSRRRLPQESELRQLSTLVGIEVQRLQEMFLPPETAIHLRTRLCPECYQEVSCHQARWQKKDDYYCIEHQIPFLSACPDCETDFCTPRFWTYGKCQTCGLAFSEMLTV